MIKLKLTLTFVTTIALAFTPTVQANEILCGPTGAQQNEYFANLDEEKYFEAVLKNKNLMFENICERRDSPKEKNFPLYVLAGYYFQRAGLFEAILDELGSDTATKINTATDYNGPYDRTLSTTLFLAAFKDNASDEQIADMMTLLDDYEYLPTYSDVNVFFWAADNLPNYDFERWKVFADYFAERFPFYYVEENNWPLFASAIQQSPLANLEYLINLGDFDPNWKAFNNTLPLYYAVTGRKRYKDYIAAWELLKSYGADDEIRVENDKNTFLWKLSSAVWLKDHKEKDGKIEPAYKDFLLYLLRNDTPLSRRENRFSEPMNLVAANVNEPELIDELLTATDSISFKVVPNGANIMTVACENSTYPEVFELLLSRGADLTAKLNGSWSCLGVLANHNPKAVEIAPILIANGADPNHLAGKPGNWTSVLQAAMQNTKVDAFELFEYFLLQGASLESGRDDHFHPILTASTSPKDTRIIEQFHKLGFDLNDASRYRGFSPLNVAVNSNNLATTEKLLELGADPSKLAAVESSADVKTTPLHVSAKLRNPKKVIDLLLKNGAPIDLLDGYDMTPLNTHLRESNEVGASFLIENGANYKLKDYLGRDSVLLASYGGLDRVLTVLKDKGASFSIRDSRGNTPLMLYCSNAENSKSRGSKRALELLLRKSEKLSTRNTGGEDALAICLNSGNLFAARELVANGASVESRYADGANLVAYVGLDTSNVKGTIEALEFLAENGVDLDQPYRGTTALHNAVSNGMEEVIRFLIDAGASGKIKNNFGQTPFEAAQYFNTISDQDLIWELNDLQFK